MLVIGNVHLFCCSFVDMFGVNYSFSTEVVCFFLTLSDEVVTAAQHLYEMVSFYFDDLGKLLFYKSWLYHQGFPWGKFIGPSPFLIYSITALSPTRSSRHSAGVHSGFQTDSSHPCRFV